MMWADIDGDGRVDRMLKAYGKRFAYSLNPGGSLEQILESLRTIVEVADGSMDSAFFSLRSDSYYSANYPEGEPSNMKAPDIDGDGLADLHYS